MVGTSGQKFRALRAGDGKDTHASLLRDRDHFAHRVDARRHMTAEQILQGRRAAAVVYRYHRYA